MSKISNTAALTFRRKIARVQDQQGTESALNILYDKFEQDDIMDLVDNDADYQMGFEVEYGLRAKFQNTIRDYDPNRPVTLANIHFLEKLSKKIHTVHQSSTMLIYHVRDDIRSIRSDELMELVDDLIQSNDVRA